MGLTWSHEHFKVEFSPTGSRRSCKKDAFWLAVRKQAPSCKPPIEGVTVRSWGPQLIATKERRTSDLLSLETDFFQHTVSLEGYCKPHMRTAAPEDILMSALCYFEQRTQWYHVHTYDLNNCELTNGCCLKLLNYANLLHCNRKLIQILVPKSRVLL